MPAYAFDFRRSCSNLDLRPERSGVFTVGIAALQLDEESVVRFNALVARLAPGHEPFTAEQIAGAGRRVLRALARGQESPFIKMRIRRIGELRAAIADARWDIDPALRADMCVLLDYLDAPDGLIPNHLRGIGLLDDAILIDVAMPRFRAELDEYADFCRFCIAAEAAGETTPIDRAYWQAERAQEKRLEDQLRRVRETRYAQNNSTRGFRVR